MRGREVSFFYLLKFFFLIIDQSYLAVCLLCLPVCPFILSDFFHCLL